MTADILSLTARIVSAHAAHNTVAVEALPTLIQSVYNTLTNVDTPTPEQEKLEPAVPIKKSIFPDYIICLEDGKKMKMMKRHLKTAYDMTPDQYRERWGLPRSYPMVAPNYAEKRSTLARMIGLGRKPVAPTIVEPKVAPKTAGRPKKVSKAA